MLYIKKTLLLFLGFFLIGLAYWTNRYFGQVTINQVVTTISFDLNGTLGADPLYLKRFIKYCLFQPFLATCAVLIIQIKIFRHLRLYYLFIFLGFVLLGYEYRIPDAFRYYFLSSGKDYFAENYIYPQNVKIKISHPKSLVLIYVESLENAYSDKALFQHDLLSRLNQISGHKISFKSYTQMPETGWTMAGIIGTQCGLPFKLITMFGRNDMGRHANSFMHNATCLSDILKEHGYQNIFMKGAELRFSGTNQFLKNHHFDEMIGKDEWIAKGINPNEMVGWGLPDEYLFKEAKIKLNQLIKKDQLFNLTILTVDTHGPEGLLSKSCRRKGVKDFQGIVECSVNEVADFVDYIKMQGWLSKLNVVVIGDHLAMQNPVSDKLRGIKTRTIFNLILTESAIHKNTDEIVHFDLLPTLLDLSGLKVEGGRIGLGYSSIGNPSFKRPSERLAIMAEAIPYDSKTYNQFWIG